MGKLQFALSRQKDKIIPKAIYQLVAYNKDKPIPIPVYVQHLTIKNGTSQSRIIFSKHKKFKVKKKVNAMLHQLIIPEIFPSLYKKPALWLAKVKAISDEERIKEEIKRRTSSKQATASLDTIEICGSTLEEIIARVIVVNDLAPKKIFRDSKGNSVTIQRFSKLVDEVTFIYQSATGLIRKTETKTIEETIMFLNDGFFKPHRTIVEILLRIKNALKGLIPALTLGLLLNWILKKLLV